MIADVSIIVPSWNTRELLARSLESVAATATDVRVETVVVDNASSDGSAAMVRARFPTAHVIQNDSNVGFARACNQGATASSSRYLLLLNSDAELVDGTLRTLVDFADEHPRCAAVSPQLRYPDGRFQASYNAFPTLWQEFLVLSSLGRLLHGPAFPSHGPETEHGPQRVDWVGGACLLIRRCAYTALGGLDEGYFMFAEEMDLCYRMRQADWEVWYHPLAVALHRLGGSTAPSAHARGEAKLYGGQTRFYRKHYGEHAARAFALQLLAWTALKHLVHDPMRLLTRGRYGRTVVPLRLLARELKRPESFPETR
jgi:GT2 family glycosyltransferase